MSRVPLTDEETKVIFSEEALATFQQLGAGGQAEIINRLLTIVESPALPSSFVREEIANLDIIAVGDQCRLYTKVVEQIPDGNSEYHILFLFYIDATHEYPQSKLAEFSRRAKSWVRGVRHIDRLDGIEELLDNHGALGEEELQRLHPSSR